MTMHFREPGITERFLALCRAKDLHGTIKREGAKQIVTVTGFVNKTARVNFLGIWATISMTTDERDDRTRHSTPRLI